MLENLAARMMADNPPPVPVPTCEGAVSSDDLPDCDGPDVQLCRFKPAPDEPEHFALWCKDCRDQAEYMGYALTICKDN